MFKALTVIALSLLAVTSANAQLPPDVARTLSQAGIPEQAVSLWVQALTNQPPRWTHHENEPRNPASVMKLLTSQAALDLLGPAYSWETAALADGPIIAGELKGNLILRGSGDPFLTWDRFAVLLRELRERGLRKIEGKLVLDHSHFELEKVDSAHFDGNGARAYNAQPDALLLNFNAITLRLSPQSDGRVRVQATLPLADLLIDNHLKTTPGDCLDWKTQVAPTITNSHGKIHIKLPGSYPFTCGEKYLNLAAPDSLALVGSAFTALWRELGGEFSGQVDEGKTPPGTPVLATKQSLPLADVLRETNKFSNNVMARQIFLTLGTTDTGATSLAQAVSRVRQWMTAQGLDPARWELENGSGLSRRERSTAAELGKLLVAAWKSPRMPQFLAALPVIGVDGTMKKRLPNSPLTGRGYVKSGTLDGVKAAAGYLMDAQGHWLAFVWLINHPHAQEAGDAVLDTLLIHLYQEGA